MGGTWEKQGQSREREKYHHTEVKEDTVFIFKLKIIKTNKPKKHSQDAF